MIAESHLIKSLLYPYATIASDFVRSMMADLQSLFRAIDELGADEFEQLYHHVAQRHQSVHWWVVPPENLKTLSEKVLALQEDSAKLAEEEINSVIDEAVAEVRQ